MNLRFSSPGVVGRRLPLRPSAAAAYAGIAAVAVVVLTACTSSVAGQAAPGNGSVAESAATSSSDSPTTRQSAASTSGAVTNSTRATTSDQTPVDLTTPASGTVAPPVSQIAGTEQTRPTTAAPANVEIINDAGSPADQLAKDAIADVTGYWQKNARTIFGKALPPLKGGYYSVDPDSKTDKLDACLNTADDVRQNAVYCPTDDSIVYDRVYLARITKDYSELDVAMTFAHEFGHALQNRFVTADQRSIVAETQADCFAGVWAHSVTQGQDPHFAFDPANLDRVLGDYIWEMGDPAGTDPNHRRAHGSVFDRVSATQEGYLGGGKSCVTNFNDDRVFSAETFTNQNASDDGKGNLSLPRTITVTKDELQTFWSTRFGQLAAGSAVFAAPAFNQDKAGAADCADTFTISYCPSAHSIDINPMKSLAEVHANIGDFATATVVTMAYTEYLQDRYGNRSGVEARICVSGAVAAKLFSDGQLSPGDLDEAVRVLVVAGRGAKLVDTGDTTAWDRLDAFRAGIYSGVTACGLKPAGSSSPPTSR